jgi:hypothetical protein
MRQGARVEVRSMQSDEPKKTVDHAEGWASLQGLMAQLALPPVRSLDGSFCRPRIEVEINPDEWEPIDSVSVESARVVFALGKREWVFLRTETFPRWRRVPGDGPRVFL